MIRDIFRTLTDRPFRRAKVMWRKGHRFGAWFYIGNTITLYSLLAVLALAIPVLLLKDVGYGTVESDNPILKFLFEPWFLLDYVLQVLLFPLFAFGGIVNFALMLFGKGQFRR